MSLRFRRRVRIAPGVSLNISKTGLGVSIGPRGAKVGIGPRGLHQSIGLPGTGVHFREETGWGKMGASHSRRASSGMTRTFVASIEVKEDGTVSLTDENGYPLAPKHVKALREQKGDEIAAALEAAAEERNAGIDRILGVHLDTPDPAAPLRLIGLRFSLPKPEQPGPLHAGWRGLIWPRHKKRVAEENQQRHEDWTARVAQWENERRKHEASEEAKKREFEEGRLSDVATMERILEERFARLAWPRETEVSFQLREDGRLLWLDVDLPEVEDMPTEQAAPAARGLRLTIKKKSETQVRREYMQHIHGVLFRIIGEAYFTLPTVEEIAASGYSQRSDPATGHVRDEYLISAKVSRSDWSKLNFGNLRNLDIVGSFENFDLRRRVSKTGIFAPIKPHVTGDN